MFDRKMSNRAAKILVQEVKLREKITIIDYDGWNNTDRIRVAVIPGRHIYEITADFYSDKQYGIDGLLIKRK
jgi:hypothetical protein